MIGVEFLNSFVIDLDVYGKFGETASALRLIPGVEKEVRRLKAHFLNSWLNFRIEGSHDFPRNWLIILQKLDGISDALLNGILVMIESLFEMLKFKYKRDDMILNLQFDINLKFCLDHFANPLLQVLPWTARYTGHGVVEVEIPIAGPSQSSERVTKTKARGKIPVRDSMLLKVRGWLEMNIKDRVQLVNGEDEISFNDNNEWIQQFGKKLKKGECRYVDVWAYRGDIHMAADSVLTSYMMEDDNEDGDSLLIRMLALQDDVQQGRIGLMKLQGAKEQRRNTKLMNVQSQLQREVSLTLAACGNKDRTIVALLCPLKEKQVHYVHASQFVKPIIAWVTDCRCSQLTRCKLEYPSCVLEVSTLMSTIFWEH